MIGYIKIKRIFDIIFASLLLLITFPIMFFTAIAIRIESNGPVLFRQNRPGKDKKIFKVYKFRSMRIETEQNGMPLSDIERMTRVGNFIRKTSIDELPQVFNVLKGEMSFIGPRPLLVQYLEYYSVDQMRRHEVTPGISGWAQVNGRNTISWEDKFKYDVWYVENISLIVDLKILWLTVYNVLNRKDINSSENNTMTSFSEIMKNSKMSKVV